MIQWFPLMTVNCCQILGTWGGLVLINGSYSLIVLFTCAASYDFQSFSKAKIQRNSISGEKDDKYRVNVFYSHQHPETIVKGEIVDKNMNHRRDSNPQSPAHSLVARNSCNQSA